MFAKSICQCGHKGDGDNSEHDGYNGHGKCNVKGCNCNRFTWKSFIPEFLKLLKGENK